jgi:hypothetical protein
MNKCPFCFSSILQETLVAREMAKGTREPFRFAICADCQSAYNLDFPSNIGEYYRGYYSFQEEELTLDQLWWKRTLGNL